MYSLQTIRDLNRTG